MDSATLTLPAAAPARPLVSRFLRPSLTDFLFLVVVYWLCMAASGGWQALLKDGDTGMHLRTGDWIAAHGKVPDKDIFSYTQPDATWYAFQWGSAVLYSKLNAVWGLRAIAFLSGIVIAVWVTVLTQAMISLRVQGLLAVLLALAGANAASIHYLARPHLITMLLLAVSMWIAESDRRRSSRWLWLLVPIAAVWANLHSGFVILPVYLGAICAGMIAEKKFADAKRYAAVTGAAVFATLLNPYGIKLYLHIAGFLSGPVATRLVDEYQSPVFRSEASYWFLILLFASLVLSGINLLQKRFADTAIVLVFAAAALVSARNIPLFVTAALPILGRSITALWRESRSFEQLFQQGAALASRCGGFTIWSAAVVVLCAVLTPASEWPADLDPKYFPSELIHRNAAVFESGRVFTTDQWGDDLIYSFRGKVPVFMDGRSDFYSAKTVGDYLGIVNGGPSWRQLLDEYRIGVVLAPAESPITALLSASGAWTAKDSSPMAVLFVRH